MIQFAIVHAAPVGVFVVTKRRSISPKYAREAVGLLATIWQTPIGISNPRWGG